LEKSSLLQGYHKSFTSSSFRSYSPHISLIVYDQPHSRSIFPGLSAQFGYSHSCNYANMSDISLYRATS